MERLKRVPSSQIRSLRALRTLNLRHNKIEDLPTALWTLLPDLQVVNISQNKLTAIPQKVKAQLEFRVPARGRDLAVVFSLCRLVYADVSDEVEI